MKKLRVMTFLAVLIIAASGLVQAQAPDAGQRRGGGQREGGRGGEARGGGAQRGGAPQQQPMAIKMIKPGLYMVTGGGGNSTVRVTDQGVILVDTKNLGDQFYNELVAQIKTVTPQPVKYAFVTHVHQDHAGNIERFQKAGTQVIVYEGLNRNLHVGGPNGK